MAINPLYMSFGLYSMASHSDIETFVLNWRPHLIKDDHDGDHEEAIREPFEVECNVSGKGIGAVLMQNRHPIAYFSKALSNNNLRKSTYEKELMALVLAIQHWRPYLLGRDFTVFTDQKSLRHLLQQRVASADQHNWMAKLLGYHFKVMYKPGRENSAAPGRENSAADALSRLPEEAKLMVMTSFPVWSQLQQIQDEIRKSKELQKDRLVLASNSAVIPDILTEFHSSVIGGHSGFLRTYKRIAMNIYWIGMKGAIQEYVKGCDTCQRQKYLASSPIGLLQPLPIPDQIWDDISMDFITGLPKSGGFEAVFVVVDRLSKYAHFILLKHPYTARKIAKIFAKEVVRLHGVPRSIVSDRDLLFISLFRQELFRLQGTALKMSSAYHPETDGQTEVVNLCLETYLRCFAAEQPKGWSQWISWAQLWVQQVAADLLDRDEALVQLKHHLTRAQQQMKKYADKRRKEEEFKVGEWVFLKLRPHRQQSVAGRINQITITCLSNVHPVFHISQLKRAVGDYRMEVSLPEGLEIMEDVDEPEDLLAVREVVLGGKPTRQYLVKWKGKTQDDVTWVDDEMLRSQFPQFSLEDKAAVKEVGNVRELETGAINSP
ncbi:hypothetical protein OSB04_027524 [Centaurea solstitialis]|uniref:Uncharacterized protein n=1 Tax=Centaurea solstitialis TaxID=347529 RepID=A0AA38SET1_9ASTR|nr:hypothetical protein OSB04_027524 [Centaurea solstitialis]